MTGDPNRDGTRPVPEKSGLKPENAAAEDPPGAAVILQGLQHNGPYQDLKSIFHADASCGIS